MALAGIFAVLPLLLMIGVGFLIAKQPWFGRAGMSLLSKLAMQILIPVYMISNVTRMYKHPAELLELLYNLPYPFILIGTALVIAALMAAPLGMRPPKRGIFINALGLSNIVVMGMPVAQALLGDRALPVVMVYYACNTITYWTAGIWIMRREVSGRTARSVAASLREAVTTPPFMGFLIGILWVLTDLPVPGFLAATMKMFGDSVTLVCMLFIGSVIRFADFRNVRKERTLRLLLPYKYLLSPVIAGFLCWLLPMPPFMKQVFFIQANMPAMAQLPIMAKEVGTDYELASLTTAITTTLSMAAVPLYIFLMEYTGIFV